MTTKKTTIETVKINGKEYNVNERLPDTFLKKDYQGIPYIDISLVRDILRQLGVLKSLRFGDIRRVFEGTNSSTLTQTAIIELKDGTILEGQGVLTVSNKKLLSGASFGVLSNLKSRAVKTALTYYKAIFELPVENEEELNEQVAEELVKKVKDEEVKQEEQVDYITKYAEFLSEKSPKDIEELNKYKIMFSKKYNLTKLIKSGKIDAKDLKAITSEWENSLQSNK